MTPRKHWVWIAVGGAGAVVIFGRRKREPRAVEHLGSPVEASETPRATPHGDYGAHRDGPPVHSHQGVDLAARAGSHVLAVGDGVIVATDPGLGKIVRKLRLDEPGGWARDGETVDAIVYADLGTPLVHPGDRVRRGDPIATVAPAGFVHFAMKQRRAGGESFIDPRRAGFVYRTSAKAVA